MKGCIFCDIAAGKLDSEVLSKNEKFMVLKDVNPQAPVHLLVIPLKHYANIQEASNDNPSLVAQLLAECARLGTEMDGGKGFRIVINTGSDGGQTVNHLHFHVLAGRALQWPPG